MTDKKIIMCPPRYYDIEYSINPWMNINTKVNNKKANEQYTGLKEAFVKHGAEVIELTPEKGLPDMIYACNSGYVEGNTFVKANFKAQQRKHEADIAEKYFIENKYRST